MNERRYKLGEWCKLYRDCINVFGQDFPIRKMIDMCLSVINGYITFDITEFMKFCKTKGLKDKESLEDYVKANYKESGINLVKAVML